MSADDDALENRHEVLDVDEGVLAAVHLERLEGFHYQFPKVFPPLLAVVDAVSQVVWNRRDKRLLIVDLSEGKIVYLHVV